MASQHTRESATSSHKATEGSKRTTIPASEVGVTLTISDKALKEIERIQGETVKAAQEDQRFPWR